MKKITSAQRRSNRFLGLDQTRWYRGRWEIAYLRRERRMASRYRRGKLSALRPCTPVFCPPFQDVTLTVL